jgi:hypothetical protein
MNYNLSRLTYILVQSRIEAKGTYTYDLVEVIGPDIPSAIGRYLRNIESLVTSPIN